MKVSERQEEFLMLLEPLLEDLSRFCLAMTRDPERARDLMGDVILAALEGFASVREQSAFLSYLFTIARRTYQRQRRRKKIFAHWNEELANRLVADGPPVWIQADVRALHVALARLPEAQQEAIVLFELTGLSLREVAEVQNVSITAVKSRLSRGRKRLAFLLGAVPISTTTPDKSSKTPITVRAEQNETKPSALAKGPRIAHI